MTWTQSLQAFEINKLKVKDLLHVPFDSKRNQQFIGRCMACQQNMLTVKRTRSIQLCKDCWDFAFKEN